MHTDAFSIRLRNLAGKQFFSISNSVLIVIFSTEIVTFQHSIFFKCI